MSENIHIQEQIDREIAIIRSVSDRILSCQPVKSFVLKSFFPELSLAKFFRTCQALKNAGLVSIVGGTVSASKILNSRLCR